MTKITPYQNQEMGKDSTNAIRRAISRGIAMKGIKKAH